MTPLSKRRPKSRRNRLFMPSVGEIGKGAARGFSSVRELAASEKRRLLEEVGAMRGLLPLLMKPRHHQQWSRADKVLLYRHVKRMSLLSPYLILLALPGGALALPALAWWLARRRAKAQKTPG
jgi:hypothetical protein